MNWRELMMKHIYEAGKTQDSQVLLLLHGTGGNESDLIPLARLVDPDAAILSVKGNIEENGMPRFFRRLAEGVFDEADLIFRTQELKQFVDDAAIQYGFNRNKVVALGYSNGANIAASLLFHYTDALQGAMMHHPMVPLRNITLPQLSGVGCFIAAGENDPICTPEESNELEALLQGAGADVQMHWERNGHRLTRTEVDAAKVWYEARFKS